MPSDRKKKAAAAKAGKGKVPPSKSQKDLAGEGGEDEDVLENGESGDLSAEPSSSAVDGLEKGVKKLELDNGRRVVFDATVNWAALWLAGLGGPGV